MATQIEDKVSVIMNHDNIMVLFILTLTNYGLKSAKKFKTVKINTEILLNYSK